MLQLQLMCRKKGNIAVQVVTIINPADVPVFKDQTHNWVSWCIHWWAGWVGDFTRCLTMLSHLMSSSYLKAAPRPDLLVSTRLTWLECHGGARGGGVCPCRHRNRLDIRQQSDKSRQDLHVTYEKQKHISDMPRPVPLPSSLLSWHETRTERRGFTFHSCLLAAYFSFRHKHHHFELRQ